MDLILYIGLEIEKLKEKGFGRGSFAKLKLLA